MKNLITTIILSFVCIQLQAQCEDPSMSIWENTWQSCSKSQSPHPIRGESHWILYDFGSIYTLSSTHIWNTNEVGKTQMGFKNVIIDYSLDGWAWKELGTFQFEEGTGEASYGGFQGFDFQGKKAQYVLITAVDNFGDAACFGLAEVKFNVVPPQFEPEEDLEEAWAEIEFEVFPNPSTDYIQLEIFSENENMVNANVQIYNLMGQQVLNNPYQLETGDNNLVVSLDKFASGMYVVSVVNTDSGERVSKKLVVVNN
jgi:hypothetical protein